MGNVFRATNSSNNNGYTMAVEFKEVKETFPEDYFNQNEEMDQARFVSLNKTYYGARTLGEEAEWFKFTLKTNSKVSIPLTDNTYCDIYNSSKEKIKSEYGYHGFYQQLELKKGTYYINIERKSSVGSGPYSFSINDGKKSSVTKPKATYITKLSKGSKRFKVSVKKQSATGYQVQYSTKSNFKGSKTKTFKGTSYTVKGLKGKKKYYVRVRSYKKSGSKTLYSAWSKKKSVKTKK